MRAEVSSCCMNGWVEADRAMTGWGDATSQGDCARRGVKICLSGDSGNVSFGIFGVLGCEPKPPFCCFLNNMTVVNVIDKDKGFVDEKTKGGENRG